MEVLLIFLALMHIPPYILARCALHWMPSWPRWVIALVSAAVAPALLLVPVVFEIVTALNSRQEECGIDTSCIAVGNGMMALALIAILFFCSFLVSALVVYPLPSAVAKNTVKNLK
jgi:hypothetical protein